MAPETCGLCGEETPLASAAHVLWNPKDGDGVRDTYLCPACYEGRLGPVLDDAE